MNFYPDFTGVIFKISVSVLVSSVLYKLFKSYGLPMLQKRASAEIGQKALLEHDYQDLIQQKLMAEKNLSNQQQQLNLLSQKITQWQELAEKKRLKKEQDASSCLEKCQARRIKQRELEDIVLMKKMLVRQALEKTREDLAISCQSAQSFTTLLNQLIKE